MRSTLFFVLFALTYSSGISQGKQIKTFSAGITEAELLEHVQVLASDEFQGRETGYEGQKKAARYIREAFKELNLIGPAAGQDPFFQEFTLVKNNWEKFLLIKNSDTLHFGMEIHVSGMWPEGEEKIEVVFAGYGADTEHYSDYTGLDVEGKIVAFLSGEPMNKNGKFLANDSYVPAYTIFGYDKAKIAAEKGAIGAIMIDPDQSKIDNLIRLQKKFVENQQFFLPGTGKSENSSNGLIAIAYENASLLFGNRTSDWLKYTKKMNRGKTVKTLKTDLVLSSAKGTNKIASENVLGMIRGSELPEEYVIVTAHYDHLGYRGNKIYNGADDNASGTAAVIEIAEAFIEAANAGFPPKRSVLFMPVSGEEKGLLGSRFYTANPVLPLEYTKAVINMDMIGRQDDYPKQDTSYVFLYLSDKEGSELDHVAKNASELEGSSLMTVYKYNDSKELSLGGSDHASFEKQDIPVLYFYCGTHADYHRPTDTWEKLDYGNMTTISRMVFASAWQLANKN